MRQLATIQRIDSIEPIDGADAIEKATILGWQCVVKKGEFKVGDLCVYFEIDSIVPDIPVFEFMRERKFRVRTIKLRGQISQGLALPIVSFVPYVSSIVNYGIGQDLTDKIGVTKYDPEAIKEQRETSVNTKGNFLREFFMQFAWFRKIHRALFPGKRRGWPEFIPKTDETRIQNYASALQGNKTWYITEKLDGQSATYFVVRNKTWWGLLKTTFGVCSRNIYLKTKQANNWWNVAEKYGIEDKLVRIAKNIAIQGEIIGPNIQANKYNRKELEFYVFNVWDIDKQAYYTVDEMLEFCNSMGLKTVPIIDRFRILGDIFTGRAFTIDDLVEMSKGTSTVANVKREGIVVRTTQNEANGKPISFKAINPEFLLKYQDEE